MIAMQEYLYSTCFKHLVEVCKDFYNSNDFLDVLEGVEISKEFMIWVFKNANIDNRYEVTASNFIAKVYFSNYVKDELC